MRPSPLPTIADLYLAFRQAKTALYFERRGVGLLELAACRLIERDVDDVVHVEIPLTELVAFHNGSPVEGWRPLQPDWP